MSPFRLSWKEWCRQVLNVCRSPSGYIKVDFLFNIHQRYLTKRDFEATSTTSTPEIIPNKLSFQGLRYLRCLRKLECLTIGFSRANVKIYGQTSNKLTYASNTVTISRSVPASSAGSNDLSGTVRVLATGVSRKYRLFSSCAHAKFG